MKLVIALILSVTAITATAKERVDIPMEYDECITQSAALASKGRNAQRSVYWTPMRVVTSFFTQTQFVTIGCGGGVMIVNKESLSDLTARANAIDAQEKAKTASLSKQLGL